MILPVVAVLKPSGSPCRRNNVALGVVFIIDDISTYSPSLGASCMGGVRPFWYSMIGVPFVNVEVQPTPAPTPPTIARPSASASVCCLNMSETPSWDKQVSDPRANNLVDVRGGVDSRPR